MTELDVVVVGAGLAGATVCARLEKARASVAVLDAGPAPPRLPGTWPAFTAATATLTEVDPSDWAFRARGRPVEWMRVRAAGGRTLLWGGWMVRPEARNLDDAAELGHPWPIAFADLDRLVRRAERLLCVRTARPGSTLRRLREAGLAARPKRASVSPSGTRPLCALDLVSRRALQPRTVVTGLDLDDSGRVRGVVCAGARPRIVRARTVVLAASPIETARILRAARPDLESVGAGLVDHLYSGAIAILDAPAPMAGSNPLGDAALVCGERAASGLGFSTEVRGPASLSSLDDDDLRLLGLTRREARHMSFVSVFVLGELAPSPQRRVRFDPRREDGLGRAMPVLELPPRSDAEKVLGDASRARCLEVARLFAGPRGVVQVRDPRDRVIAHEAGTCRMGLAGAGGVTDVDGAVYGTPGLYVADASRMPSALDRHPSLTIAALALGTADRVIEDLR